MLAAAPARIKRVVLFSVLYDPLPECRHSTETSERIGLCFGRATRKEARKNIRQVAHTARAENSFSHHDKLFFETGSRKLP